MISGVEIRAIPHTASPLGSLRRAALCLAVVALALAAPEPAGAAAKAGPGTLDPSFASSGTLIRGFGTVPGSGWALETAPMPDGGFVVHTSGGSIGRYLADGSLDPRFGENGYLIDAEPRAIATTASGRIYVLGLGRNGLQVSRLLPDSAPDPSFGRRGTVYLGRKAPPLAAALATADGGVILAGTDFPAEQVSVGAMRVNADGSVDRDYGSGGVARALYSRDTTGKQFVYAVDGDRLTFVSEGSYFLGGGTDHRDLVLGRFGPDGRTDAAFTRTFEFPLRALPGGLSGIATAPDGETVISAQLGSFVRLPADGTPQVVGGEEIPTGPLSGTAFAALAIQPDGKIVLGGIPAEQSEPRQFILARLKPDGSLDPTFGSGDGIVTTGLPTPERVSSLITLADGSLLLSGEGSGGSSMVVAARYTPDGAIDPRFGDAGILAAQPVAHSDDRVNAVLAGPGGDVVATGTAGGRILVADYLANGRPNPAFADRGVLLMGSVVDSAPAEGSALARYPGNRIVIGTKSRSGASLIMLDPHGHPDRSFGKDGVLALADFDFVSDLAVTATGAVLVAGSSRPPPLCRSLVERFAPGGRLDRSFGKSGAAGLGAGCGTSRNLDLAQRPDGSFLVAIEGTKDLEEFTPAGRPSPAFSLTSRAYEKLPKHLGAIALDDRGRLLVGGTLHHRLGLIRLDRRGRLDGTFGRRGKALREVGRDAAVTALRVEADGRILAAGNASVCPPFNCGGPTAFIARFGADGAIDPAFGRGGVWTGRREGSALGSLALDRDGTLLAGGWSVLHRDRDLLLVKVRR
jgi:uncharacterized delta-60 repeat protein